jgi:Cdc6-like AAA superfamily ATPase
MQLDFDAGSLVSAIRSLFELNHYEVVGPTKINGAEIDLVATPRSTLFGTSVYIEATIEYVDNDKYGKDIGKLAIVRELDPSAQRVIVSSKGFSLPVRERAAAARVTTLTYGELFAKFERFEPYLNSFLTSTPNGRELDNLNNIYEEPYFDDALGQHQATVFLDSWLESSSPSRPWLVVVGEYGTGKTALTRVLQYRWISAHRRDPKRPIPFRIELRDFSRQFDARGLLHHFLDFNGLGHLSLDFVESLIRSGRAVLLLDGYDEMAQYLSARERRTCLEALATLSAGGARGILTSRPNYFTEAEELQVFETLYSTLQNQNYYLTVADKNLLAQEAAIDRLLGTQFIDRFERQLKDLDERQTEALVNKVLKDDPAGRAVITSLLSKIFRSDEQGNVSLSGKPVIISYLLDIVEGLKEKHAENTDQSSTLGEWQIYKLIVDQLMLRDLRRSPEMSPDERRHFLQRLALLLSRPDRPAIDETDFKDLISREFASELRRRTGEEKGQLVEKLFADLRGSATLTRADELSRRGWCFSHNSLREYLVSEYCVRKLEAGQVVEEEVPISDAMRLFIASLSRAERTHLLDMVSRHWGERGTKRGYGQLLTLLWDSLISLYSDSADPVRSFLEAISGRPIGLNSLDLTRVTVSSEQRACCLAQANFSTSVLVAVDFSSADLRRANFAWSIIDNVRFENADLRDADFGGALIIDADFSGCSLIGTDIRGVNAGEISILIEDDTSPLRRRRLQGLDALGFLNLNGALTERIPERFVVKYHRKFPIVAKILEKLAEQRNRQRRGLVQRGAARGDIKFARQFLQRLEAVRVVEIPGKRDLVQVTEQGREILGRFGETGDLPTELVEFIMQWR